MASLLQVWGTNLAAAAALMLMVWLLSLRLRDVSIVDIFWGAAGAFIALLTFVTADGALPRRALLTSLTVLWGVRLSLHIGLRNWGKPEDFPRLGAYVRHWLRWTTAEVPQL